MDRHRLFSTIAVAGFFALASAGLAQAQQFSTKMSGFQVTGGLNAETGAILTNATGTLSVDLNKAAQMATYTLTFSNLTSPPTMAHIHFGKNHVPGGILIWLCQTRKMPSPVPGTPHCPRNGGTVTGTITAASVVAIPGQNVAAGDFDALEDALTFNTAYANVHSVKFPSGEIRGQLLKNAK